MFTGLINAKGVIQKRKKQGVVLRIFIQTQRKFAPGESVAIDGVCCTVEKQEHGGFWVSLVLETQKKTTLGKLRIGASVHLEPSLRHGDSFGGHFVSGHVDGVGRVLSLQRHGGNAILVLSIPSSFRKFCTQKGSLCVNGVSLTVSKKTKTGCAISLIPYTLAHTNLGTLRAGDFANIEVDLLARYRKPLQKRSVSKKPRIGIIQTTFYTNISRKLLHNAKKALQKAGLRAETIVSVPGALELSIAAQRLLSTGKYDGLVALGCVIQGETDHYYHVAHETMHGLMNVSLQTGIPIGFGILTVKNHKQAEVRVDKGNDAVRAVLRVLSNVY